MITFRIDDIGASTKKFNQHARWKWGNVWFLKRVWPFKKWGPYQELTVAEWREFMGLFQQYRVRPIVSITASWVREDGGLVPFPEKFPQEAQFLKEAADRGLITIANHGLTHCVVGSHLPSFWRSNRTYHREFWPWIPEEIHHEHICRSQEILEGYFGRPVTIFVPPGSVWSIKTARALSKTKLRTVISQSYMLDHRLPFNGIEFIDDRSNFFNFHDRELKLFGAVWLERQLKEYA